MTPLTLTMPRLGETMEEGLITGWLVAPGQAFKRGDPILELETDKTSVEFPALGDGVIDEVLAGPGDRIAVGKAIAKARVSNPADWSDDSAAPEPEPAPAPTPAQAAAPALLRMPRLGETMDEGVVVQWLVAEGASYARGDAILEIETDKTVAEVPALYPGRLLKILAGPGEKLAVGAAIAEVEGEVEPFEGDTAGLSPLDAAPAQTSGAANLAPVHAAAAGPLRATPLARRLARQKGISLTSLTGSGRRGRIEKRDVEGAGPALAQGMAMLETAGGELAYRVTGQGGRTFVLLHGFAGDHSAWATLAAALARAGHHAVIPDLPGHGATSLEAADLSALTDAATKLVESLGGKVTLVGHSLGAAVAVAVAGRLGAKVADLVLLTPAGCGPTIGADFVHGMASASSAGEVSHLLRLLGPKGAALSEAALSQMAAAMAKGRLKALAQSLTTPEGRQKLDLLRPLASLEQPVTALFGTLDQVVSASDALNLPVNVAAHFLATGHMPQWDAPAEVAALILKGG